MVGGQARPSALGGGDETLSLTKLSQEMCRIEYEAQSQLHAMVQEINKLKKDREVSWKHVVEVGSLFSHSSIADTLTTPVLCSYSSRSRISC